RFPHYGYADMVEGQRRLLVEKLGVKHLRLVVGTSMGCMHSWVWAEAQPKFMDANLALACLPVQIAGRNRVVRKLAMDSIRSDPAWNGGEYKSPPLAGLTALPSLTTKRSISATSRTTAQPIAMMSWPSPSRRRNAGDTH